MATATPISWMKEIELVLKAPIAAASRTAAAVTTRPVAPSPSAIASRSSSALPAPATPARRASLASLIRLSRNTP